MLPYEDAVSLPLLLHLNSEPWMNLDAYAAQSAEVPFPVRVPAPGCVALPAPCAGDADAALLSALLARRRSVRGFEPLPLPLAMLSSLLADSYGVQAMATLPDGMRLLQRPLPSAGALYPLELHLLLRRIDGAADGIWRYEPLHHRLEPVGPLPPDDELAAMLLAQPYVAEANAVVFLVGAYRRTLAKYGMRGYRYLLLEAGHAAQNLALAATAAGLDTLCIGGFRDHLVNRLFGLDEREAVALYAVAVGRTAEGGGVSG